ncbi:MAG: exodeoxyribonuclease VII small subunit [Brevefilum sp.]|jgi:exodeoxyribonuclease VII small subunit
MSETDQKDIQDMDFETAFTALQDNLVRLESENLPLQEALSLYERGQTLARHCADLLDRAELKVRQLSMESPEAEEE